MNRFRLKTCIKCQGDLAADNGDWLCLQCGIYYYTGLYQLHRHLDDAPNALSPQVPSSADSNISEQPEKKHLGIVTAPLFADPRLPVSDVNATTVVAATAAL